MAPGNNMKQLAVSMAAYTATSILGPLILFGGAGYYIGKQMGGGKTPLFVGIGIAFIVTNVLQFFKIKALMRKMNEESKKEKENQ